MTYHESLSYLDSFVNYEKRGGYDYKESFKLDRMRGLASSLGNPQEYFRSIHIAGTKGKGSTSAIVHSILKEAGYKAGLYTSPHLASFRERIRIGDCLIGEEDMSRLLAQMKSVMDRMNDDRPTFFEVYTALSFLYFKENGVDIAVFEVGLGGSLDATNILEPLVSAITPISYEHTDKLGKTLTAIAREKAGIIKDNSICVLAPQEEEALSAIVKVCNDKKAKAILVGKDMEPAQDKEEGSFPLMRHPASPVPPAASWAGSIPGLKAGLLCGGIKFKEIDFNDSKELFDVKGMLDDYPGLEMSLLGAHQVANAATAIGVIEALRFHNICIDKEAVRRGVKAAKWPGRLEVVSKNPCLILDGAQNRASAKALALAVKRAFKYNTLTLVLGVSSDKDIRGILDELLPIAGKIILTKSKVVDRAADPRKIKELIPGNDDIYLTDNVEEAVEKARSVTGNDGLILVTGSLFVVGEAREILIR